MKIQSNQSNAPRIATYSQDGLGLGHMRRTHTIARQFLHLRPDGSVLTLSDSQLGQFFTPLPHHDYLKLPSIVKDGPGQWRATHLNLPFAAVSELRQEIICRAVLSFRPHILLVDHMPHGAMGELLPTLAALRASGAETKVVLGLRDILDAPAVVQQRWQVEGAYDAVEQYYDRVLIYGMQEVFDMAAHYGFSASVANRLHYCGYVCAPTTPVATHDQAPPTPAALRAALLGDAPAATRLIVAMAGGGADAYPLMHTLLAALPTVQQHHPIRLALVTGPFMPADQRAALQSQAQGLPVQILTAVDDSYGYLQAADLVVAMAGYNTTMEILQTRRRSILVPRRGPSAEQRTRTRLFAERSWIDMLDPDDLYEESLAHLVIKNLHQGPVVVTTQPPKLNGMEVAAEELLALSPTPATVARHRHPPQRKQQKEKRYAMAYH